MELPADAEKNLLLYSSCKVVIARELQTEYLLKDFGIGCKETIAKLETLRAIDDATNCGSLDSDA